MYLMSESGTGVWAPRPRLPGLLRGSGCALPGSALFLASAKQFYFTGVGGGRAAYREDGKCLSKSATVGFG